MAAPVTNQYPRQNPLFKEYFTDGRKDIGIYGDNYLPGRYFSRRDMNLLWSVNAELMGDIIECVVQVFKISPEQTNTNIYGESKSETGKVFFPGIDLTARVQTEDLSSENKGFGPDRKQDVVFMFTVRDCITTNYYAQIGDLVFWNMRYYEVNNVLSDQQLLGGHPDKTWSIIVNTQYTRLTKINSMVRS